MLQAMGLCNFIYKHNYTRFVIKQYIHVQTSIICTSNIINRPQKLYSINDFIQRIKTGKEFYLKQLVNVFNTIDFNQLKSEDAIILLKCCGSEILDSSSEVRHKLCKDIFNGLDKVNNLNIAVYNSYIRTCNENNAYLNKDFLFSIRCKPDSQTYKLLIENACQLGKLEEAYSILELMKENNVPVDITMFNNLAMGYALKCGLEATDTVLNTMRSAQILENNTTKISILKGLIRRKDLNDLKKAIERFDFEFTEDDFLKILLEFGLVGNEDIFFEINKFYNNIIFSRELQAKIEKICIYLIHMCQPESAMKIYETYVTPYPEVSYGHSILKEMLHCRVNIEIIIRLAQNLVEKDLNTLILEKLTVLTLELGYLDESWALFKSLKILRIHYFWPLFIHYGNNDGENGIFYTLLRMNDYNMKPDSETFINFIFPFCNWNNTNLLVTKFRNSGFTIKEIIRPLLAFVLQKDDISQAASLCTLYKINITDDKILQLLSKSWFTTKDSTSALQILKQYYESKGKENDSVGEFLISSCTLCNSVIDFQDFSNLLTLVHQNNLSISSRSAQKLQNFIYRYTDEDLKTDLYRNINLVTNMMQELNEETNLPHPKDMDLQSLECHLIELEEKKMETRGVIRRLIQVHAKDGNLQRIQELQTKLSELGYESSAGMKSSIMHNFVLGGYVEEALNIYKDIKSLHPDFLLDSFKFIDLAALLFKNDRFDEALHILESEPLNRDDIDSRSIQRNCRELLNSCTKFEDMMNIFNLLVKRKLCNPTNVMLGPLVRIHLNSGHLEKTVSAFLNIANEYKCTPLQLEVLCFVIKEGDKKILEKIISAIEDVHGVGPAQLGLIAALAECNKEQELKKILRVPTMI
ncbi:leucine-rich PPR motif-containing protein, mitochondrial isoform X2 [Sitophilus oryzae]|uniref:Leucine-rich PPR motif-containing protein, mitochondrial isoform X2 n=1 Tax=Sitophilus oryzae TaxID=7048 RepID=A0A6J2YXA9_SITOR|nr:leucine-rich PPR motif-containing protein, mitochondrial isoform X2 [Sitophilus oryzae]